MQAAPRNPRKSKDSSSKASRQKEREKEDEAKAWNIKEDEDNEDLDVKPSHRQENLGDWPINVLSKEEMDKNDDDSIQSSSIKSLHSLPPDSENKDNEEEEDMRNL